MNEPQGARFEFEGAMMTVGQIRKQYLPAYSPQTIRRYLRNGVKTRQEFLAEGIKMHAKIRASGVKQSKKLSGFTLERRIAVKHKNESGENK